MNEPQKLSLPGSGYDQLSKILHAYALCGEKPATLDEVAAKAAMNATIVSRNNGFLVSLNLLTGGKAKTLTAAGKDLALALGHDLEEDAALAWRRAILDAPAAKPILDMLRVQKTVAVDALPARIAATLGQPDSAATKTGTNTLIEILRHAALIKEAEGKITLLDASTKPEEKAQNSTTSPRSEAVSETEVPTPMEKSPSPQPLSPAPVNGLGSIPIHVNIELHLPASAEQAVYDALFKSIREHLLNR